MDDTTDVKNDAPTTMIVLGIIFIFLGLLSHFFTDNNPVDQSDIEEINGTLLEFRYDNDRNGTRYMVYNIKSNGVWFKLKQYDLTRKHPGLSSIDKGAHISAVVSDMCCASNLKHLWELRANNKLLLPMESTIEYNKSRDENFSIFLKWTGLFGALLLTAGFILKKHNAK